MHIDATNLNHSYGFVLEYQSNRGKEGKEPGEAPVWKGIIY